jgi:hypothetical protein
LKTDAVKELLTIGVLGLVLSHGLLAACGADKPNIIIILTDDQGHGDLGCYGAMAIAPPNIDRIPAAGMKFDSLYVHTRGSPECGTWRRAPVPSDESWKSRKKRRSEPT